MPHPPRPRRFRRRAPPPGRRRARDDRSARRRRGHLPPRPEWTEFDDLFREFFVDGRRGARRGRPRRRREGGARRSAKPAARKKGVSPRPTAGGVTAAYDKIREEARADDEELRARVRAGCAALPRSSAPIRVSKIARRRRLRRLRRRLRRRDPKPRAERATRGPVRDPALARPKKKGLLRTPTKGKKIASSSPRRRPSEKTVRRRRRAIRRTIRSRSGTTTTTRPAEGPTARTPIRASARRLRARAMEKGAPRRRRRRRRRRPSRGWRGRSGGAKRAVASARTAELRGMSPIPSGARTRRASPRHRRRARDPDEEAIQTRDRSRGRKSLFAAVTGALGFGTAAAAKSEAAEAKRARAAADLESSDEEDAIATTPVRKRKRAPGRPRKETPIGRANRHSRRKVLAAGGAPSPGPRAGFAEEEEDVLDRGGGRGASRGRPRARRGQVGGDSRRQRGGFSRRARTLMDLKDKWRNLERAKARPVVARASGEEGGEGGSGAAAPTSPRWRRFLALPAMLGGGGSPRGASASAADASSGLALEEAAKKPRQPGVANRHSAYRKLAGADDGSRKTRAPWLEEEVAALRLGVETFGEGEVGGDRPGVRGRARGQDEHGRQG